MKLTEVILRSELTGGVAREARLAVGDVLQRGAGTVRGLEYVDGALAVLTTDGVWVVTPVGWCRVLTEPPSELEKPARKTK
jgi:hypothetical protein